jgi:alkylation response protein AidB-like acyl-CoA dehydrogenase
MSIMRTSPAAQVGLASGRGAADLATELESANETRFRDIFRSWLNDNLPMEWRSRSHGATDAELSQIRVEIGRRLGTAGWLSATWPKEFGLGLPASRRIILLGELVAHGAPEPMNANSIGIFAPTLIRFGDPEQCARFLPSMLSHDVLWCQGFSEPDAGSDLAGVRTRGQVRGDELVVTGQKIWTSYAHLAQYCYLLVRTLPDVDKHHGLTLVAMPLDQPGVTIRPLRNIAGTDEFCEVFLDEARAPLDNIVGEQGGGWRAAMYALAQERSVGLAQRSLKMVSEFDALAAMCEEQFDLGNPAMTADVFADGLVDAYVRSRVVDATVARAVEIDGRGGDLSGVAPVAKLSWSEGHQRQLAFAMEVLGADAVLLAGPGRAWWTAALFARAETIYGGTSQIQRNLLARFLALPKGR